MAPVPFLAFASGVWLARSKIRSRLRLLLSASPGVLFVGTLYHENSTSLAKKCPCPAVKPPEQGRVFYCNCLLFFKKVLVFLTSCGLYGLMKRSLLTESLFLRLVLLRIFYLRNISYFSVLLLLCVCCLLVQRATVALLCTVCLGI